MLNTIDRCRGCLVGLAVGDGLGVAVEFAAPGTFEPITTYRSGGPHNLEKGQWSDDTSMALALADSIKHGWNLNDQASRYVQWLEEGKYSVNGWCFDIGCTTRQALERFMDNRAGTTTGKTFERFIECSKAMTTGLTEPENSGNGGIMRIAPVAIRYHDYQGSLLNGVPILYWLGEESSSVTHASEMCKSAAGYMTMVLAALIRGEPREEALRYYPTYEHLLHPAINEVVKGSYKQKSPPIPDQWWPDMKGVIRGSGFVVESLEAALWAFYNAQDYKEAVLRAVNLGEDSDTTGAICGQFAGAYWGEQGIPQELRDSLARKDMIEDALNGLIPEN